MMSAAPEGSISRKFCSGMLTALTVIILLLADLQCQCFLVDADGDAGTSVVPAVEHDQGCTLLEDSGDSWKSMLGAAENFGPAAFDSTSPLNRRGNLENGGPAPGTMSGTATSHRGKNQRSRLQVEALTAFKAAITDDPLGTLQSWRANDSDACGWVGVECSSKHRTRLIAIDLTGAQLVGSLNSALRQVGLLRYLRRLDLSNNVFSGSIPAASLVSCSKLLYLNVSNNQLSGEIPSEIEEIVSLKTLDFGGNNLTGQIPLSLGNCSFLRVLDLRSNLLEGPITPLLGRLSNLEFLDLSKNSLSGSIPLALGNCSSLTYINFNYNSDLGGELPPNLGHLKSLQIFDLSFCNFQGAIPIWLGNLTALRQVVLEYNQFQGEIPADANGQSGSLSLLALRNNNLTGAFPVSVTNQTALIWLGLQYNNFTGNIPPDVGMLTSLTHLLLEGNSFTGVIPSSMANCSALKALSLGLNQLDPQIIPPWILSFTNLKNVYFDHMNLQGGIPAEIGRLSNLQNLELRSNNLSGVIPSSLANCSFLKILDVQKNKLTGGIPSELGLLQHVIWFKVEGNLLSGSFPSFLENFTQIEMVDIGKNSLIGTIDGNFGRLSHLQSFTASFNAFSGPIPETFSNCSSLYLLNFFENKLNGSIPLSWGNMTLIRDLDLGYNSIAGKIPMDLMRCSTLGYLGFIGNNLEGSLPSNIGQLSSLKQLYLADNIFTGKLPTSLSNFSDMIFLDLSYNRFTGNVPAAMISQMSSSLTSLNVSHNLFSGSWPPQLSELENIQFLDVSSNNISGSLPASVGMSSWTLLSRLDVSVNDLTGAIPQYIGQLGALTFLNVSYNNFEGPLPDSVAFEEKFTEASFLGNPGLCGIILSFSQQECTVRSNRTSHKSCEGFKCKHVWIPITCAGVGVALILAGALGWLYSISKGTNTRRHPTYVLAYASDLRFTQQDVLRNIAGYEDNIIGVGANNVVFKGVLAGGEKVAVKLLQKLEGSTSRRKSELVEEVRSMAQLRHCNLLKVLCFYSSVRVTAIILEYVSEGSLHKHLHELREESGVGQLTWPRRFNIAVGVAEAMVYLHHDFPKPLIHRDLKAANILLDSSWDPKVAVKFGLCKFANPSGDRKATASKVCGTAGYIPPEYWTGPRVSTEGDVYSYGVVLLELLTGKQPASSEVDRVWPDHNLRGWVMNSFETRPFELLDATLQQEGVLNTSKKEQMLLLMRVALFCTKENPQHRPTFKEVLTLLAQIKAVGLFSVASRTTGVP